jgi:hypothetical protein
VTTRTTDPLMAVAAYGAAVDAYAAAYAAAAAAYAAAAYAYAAAYAADAAYAGRASRATVLDVAELARQAVETEVGE